jgi:hypothetical protein
MIESIRDIFKSRIIAGANFLFVCDKAALDIHVTGRVGWWAIAMFVFWLTIFCGTILGRRQERRQRMIERYPLIGGAEDSIRASIEERLDVLDEPWKSGEEEAPPATNEKFCFDCAVEGRQVSAPFEVARGPAGERVPVCQDHARVQAVKNAGV